MKKDELPNLHLYLVATELPDRPYCTYLVCADDDDEAKELVEMQADDYEQLAETRLMKPVHPGIVGWMPTKEINRMITAIEITIHTGKANVPDRDVRLTGSVLRGWMTALEEVSPTAYQEIVTRRHTPIEIITDGITVNKIERTNPQPAQAEPVEAD
jgi:hypothetical protein